MAFESFRQLRQYRNDLSLKEYWGTAPPSSTTDQGPFAVGDIVWNTAPAVGTPVGWECVTAGADGSIAVFVPFVLGLPSETVITLNNTTSFTLTGAQLSGGLASISILLTGTLGGAANITLPTVANLVAALAYAHSGLSFGVRIINASAGAFAWTVVTNTGWTTSGTLTINQNTWRDFIVNLTSLTTATITSVGTGTYS